MQHTSPRLLILPTVMNHPVPILSCQALLTERTRAREERTRNVSTRHHQKRCPLTGKAFRLLAQGLTRLAVFTPGEARETETFA